MYSHRKRLSYLAAPDDGLEFASWNITCAVASGEAGFCGVIYPVSKNEENVSPSGQDE